MRLLTLCMMSALLAVPAAAETVADFAKMSDKELQAALREAGTDFSSACDRGVPLWREAAARFTTIDLVVPRTLAEVFCAIEQEKYAHAADLLRPVQDRTGEFGDLALRLAVTAEDGRDALAQLQGLAAQDRLGAIELDLLYRASRLIHRNDLAPELRRLATDVAGMPSFKVLDPAAQSMFAQAALRDALARQTTEGVEPLLPYIRAPTTWRDMLAEREYEEVWPLLQQHAGLHLETVSEAYVGFTAAQLAQQPDDADRVSAHAHALLYAGHYEEAIAAARAWDLSGEAPQEGAGWAKNIEAYALDALGRQAEADAVFGALAALDADAHPWIVNFVINRASRLVGHGRWVEGLEATALARSVAERHGSTYARMIIARDRACALQQLGQTAEVEPELTYLRENQTEAPHMAITGLLCAGLREEAVALLRQQLTEQRTRDLLIDELQDDRFDLFYTPSQLPRARDLILAEPELNAVALRHVRQLPDDLVPVAWLRRTVRPQRTVQ